MADAIRALAAGRIDMIAFTSSPQVERLVEVAREADLETQLSQAFQRARIAAIGPVVEEALRQHGVASIVRPKTSFPPQAFGLCHRRGLERALKRADPAETALLNWAA